MEIARSEKGGSSFKGSFYQKSNSKIRPAASEKGFAIRMKTNS